MPDTPRSHYTVLGVAPRATSKEIRVAYLNLARALHPDRVREGSDAERNLAERRMREVNEAYDVLGDTTKRQVYDRERDRAAAAGRPRPQARPEAAPTSPPRRPPGNPERFDADPRWREEAHFGHQSWMDEDDVEVSPFVAFLLHRGPLIALLMLAAFLFVATAYAGGRADDGTTTTVPTTIEACNDTPVTGVTGGSVVLEPC